ncbi:hypothetical protein H9P43_006736 [Blastocladiella emersonii ATCC 22665]|nr:hypothetical protein H9P43_006736 [Blastocladiella emersonii ATCC 22665]
MTTPYISAREDPVHYRSRRSAFHSRKYMVAASQPLAVHAGIRLLERGANAAEAAVAVAAALNVTEPGSCGIGGDMFCLFYNAKDGTVKAVNGSGRSPAALTQSLAQSRHPDAGARLPATSPLSITVPGAVAGWIDTLERFGTGKFPLTDLLAPAIDLAENGFPVSRFSAWQWAKAADRLLAASPNGAEVLLADDEKGGKPRAPREGETMYMRGLAATLRRIGELGKAGFYEGPVAEAIVDVVQQCGGVMTLDDLKQHASTFENPISIEYGGVRLWECAPNGQGLVAILALGILEQAHALGIIPTRIEDQIAASSSSDSPLPASAAHHLINALRLAFADAQTHVADPSVAPRAEIVAQLLSPAHLQRRARELASPTAIPHGAPRHASGTVYFSVGDADGNACSFIYSNYMGFGHGAVPRGGGFTLQNRGCGFDLRGDGVNAVAPGKRPYHTIIPGMLTTGGDGEEGGNDLVAAFGVMGGFMQPQGHAQVLLQYLAARKNGGRVDPQDALDAPRFCLQPEQGADGEPAPVDVEAGLFTDADFADLCERGHNLRALDGAARAMFGRGQWVGPVRDAQGKQTGWVGASDGRADGCAFGW